MVRVDEGQIAYFGPWNGGIAALSELDRIVLDRRPQTPNWQLHQPGRRELEIPVTAEGAEALFVAFSALPGFDTRVMLAALHAVDQKRTEIWERPALRLH